MSYKQYYQDFKKDVANYYGEPIKGKKELNMDGCDLSGFNVIEVDIDSFGAKQLTLLDVEKEPQKK